jgi:hypothetical protein
MSNPSSIFQLQSLVSRFANSFDLKEWDNLADCLTEKLHTDYSDLRGTPPEVVSREEFVQLRRKALHDLRTQHLSGNLEIELSDRTAKMKVSMVIYRRNEAEQTFNTHCVYFFEAERVESCWQINSITQKVLMNDGQSTIHQGAAKA